MPDPKPEDAASAPAGEPAHDRVLELDIDRELH